LTRIQNIWRVIAPLRWVTKTGVGHATRQQFGPRALQVTLDPGPRFFAQGHDALLRSFADDAHQSFGQRQFAEFQSNQLGHAQSGRIEQLEHRAIPQAERVRDIGGRQKRFHLRLADRPWETDTRWAPAVGVDPRTEAFAQRPTIEAAQYGQPSICRCRTRHRMLAGHVRRQVSFARGCEGRGARRQPARQAVKILSIGGERVARQSVFKPESIEKAIDQRIHERR
jgi:hypothetical protein